MLRWRAEPRDPARILELLSSPATLAAPIRKTAPPDDAMAQRWLVELDSPTATVREAFQTFSERLGTLLDSPAGRSLGTGEASVRLDDVIASGGKLLVRLDPPVWRAATLDELVAMLTTFEVLKDKRRGRCWSPTKYADGASSRANAGVESVSCLVFDCDRVPPDEERLAGVYWIGHTTWSHTPQAPRWRVVVPLARAVPAAQWRDVWLRARAALCPEADPSCKDASRAYWLPSHNGGVSAKTARHTGPLLDPSTLPALPPEPRRSASRPVRANAGDGRRAEAYMGTVIDNFEKAAPGGRNAALNRAAWTLGRWIGAGAIEQTAVEDALYGAAERNGLVADDGARQCWATIGSGLGAGLQQSVLPE